MKKKITKDILENALPYLSRALSRALRRETESCNYRDIVKLGWRDSGHFLWLIYTLEMVSIL